MELPSKELLETVLYVEVTTFHIEDKELIIDENWRLNIYELMHLMKEYANKLDKQYELNSYITQHRTGSVCEVYEAWHGNTEFGDFQYESVGKTEFEAVTKACEWILKESK